MDNNSFGEDLVAPMKGYFHERFRGKVGVQFRSQTR